MTALTTCLFFISALTKVYEKANSVVSCDVACPTWLHKYIIGKKGASIQKLTCDLPKVPPLANSWGLEPKLLLGWALTKKLS